MSIVKKAFLNFSGYLPIGLLKKISPIDIYLPYHHLVSDEFLPYIRHLYPYKNEKQFISDLDFLLAHFEPANVDDLVSYVKESLPLPRNKFLLTFDDGFSQVFSVIAPILYQKGIPAIFFLNNDFINNQYLFYRSKISLLIDHFLTNPNLAYSFAKHLEINSQDKTDIIRSLLRVNNKNMDVLDVLADDVGYSFSDFLVEKKPFLTTGQIHQLVKMGFHIGGHGINHPYFPLLSDEEQVNQAVKSTTLLADQFGQKYKFFSFPHNDADIKQDVIKNILKGGIDILFGIQNQLPELNNNMLHRFNAERPSIPIENQIKGEMLMAFLLKLSGRFNVSRNTKKLSKNYT